MSMRSVPCWLLTVVWLAWGSAAFAGEGPVALQTGAPSCGNDSGDRYVDCGNGTVTDNDSGLVWLANANCFGAVDWHSAMEIAAGLSDVLDCGSATADECDCGLSDGSSPGEWRLPSVTEWETMVDDADQSGCVPRITIDKGSNCWFDGCELPANGEQCSFYGVESFQYWSAHSWPPTPGSAIVMNLATGSTGSLPKVHAIVPYVWPVRGGQ